MKGGRLSADIFNEVVDETLSRYDKLVDHFEEELMASGVPPFAVPETEVGQYQKLLAMEAAGDPDYHTDPVAQKALAKFKLQFGGA